jgi:hypothetical protein
MRLRRWLNFGPRVRLQVTRPRPRAGVQLGCAGVVVLLLLLMATAVFAQDKLLVSIELSETQERMVVEALLDADSILHLPHTQVAALIGTEIGSGPWVSLDAIRAAFPAVVVAWIPAEMRVLLIDRMRSLPASQRAHQQVVARSRWSLQVPVWSGPFFAAAVDDSLHGLFDLGYTFRGRLSLAGRYDDRGTALWGATLAPSPHLFISYQDGVYRPPTFSGRVQAGPAWLAGAYTPGIPVDVQGLIYVGPVQLFASKQHGTITVQSGMTWSAQVARHWRTGRMAARVTLGPAYASPFAFPTTTLR